MDPTDPDALDWQEIDREEARFRRKRLAPAAGGEDIGTSLYEIPPGGRAWPYHYHDGNEEAIYVLAGRGRLRTPDGETPLEVGDYVAFPVGPEGAHRVSNPGDDPLRYLAISTMSDPDVTVYPDSEKIGVYAGSPPGGTGDRDVEAYFRRADAVDYWLDEDGSTED